MKKIIAALLLLFSSSTLYPLTLSMQDEVIIAALQLTGLSLGMVGSVVVTKKYISYIPHSIPAEDEADRAVMRADFMQWFRSFLVQYFAPAIVVTITPFLGCIELGDRVATFYIAHKYKVPYQEALEIKNSLDRSYNASTLTNTK